jgi:hypothetical protein
VAMSAATFNRRPKASNLHSPKDRLDYERRLGAIRRDLLVETKRLIVSSRELIAQARPPELWPLYEDGPSPGTTGKD